MYVYFKKAPTPQVPQIASNYLLTVNQLSARNSPVTVEDTHASEQLTKYAQWSSYLTYVPMIMPILLFISFFIFFLIQRSKNLKNITIAFILAAFAAGIPALLTSVQTTTHQSVNAGPEEIPREFLVQKTSESSVLITWKTDAEKIGSVRITPVSSQISTPRVYTGDSQKQVRIHTIQIPNLVPRTTYQIEILSGTTWYDNEGKPLLFGFR